MSKVFHRIGATQRQVSQLEQAQVKYLKSLREDQARNAADAEQRLRAELKKSWTSGYDSKWKAAELALRGYAGDRDGRALANLELADGTKLRHNAAWLRMLAAVGENSSSSVRAAGGSPEEAQQEIKKIQNEAIRRGLDPTSRSWPHETLDLLYKRAFGTKKIDQSMQRGNEELACAQWRLSSAGPATTTTRVFLRSRRRRGCNGR
jgi:hypothetical protein